MYAKLRLLSLAATCVAVLSHSAFAEVNLLERGAKTEWRYLDDGSDQGKEWSAPDFDDAGWKKGKAPFGYGERDQETDISFGDDPGDKHITTYFRTTFAIAIKKKHNYHPN